MNLGFEGLVGSLYGSTGNRASVPSGVAGGRTLSSLSRGVFSGLLGGPCFRVPTPAFPVHEQPLLGFGGLYTKSSCCDHTTSLGKTFPQTPLRRVPIWPPRTFIIPPTQCECGFFPWQPSSSLCLEASGGPLPLCISGHEQKPGATPPNARRWGRAK